MSHDVFISHSTQDKAVADAVCATLEGRGLRCWVAPRDVPPGEPWAQALIAAIGSSRAFVLILSNGSKASSQVMREVQEAADREIPIIPLRVDNVQPSPEMGFYIKRIHWLDALTPPLEKHLHRLAERVAALLALEEEPPAAPPVAPVAKAPMPGLSRPWVVYAAGAALLLSLAGWLGWRLGHDDGPLARPTAAEPSPIVQTQPPVTPGPSATSAAQPAPKTAESPTAPPVPAATARAAATATARLPATPVSGATAAPASDTLLSYVLPQSRPTDLAWDGAALWVLYYDDMIRLEPVEGELRFRAAESTGLRASFIAGAGSPSQFWAVSGSPMDGTLRLARLDKDGNASAEYTFPETFDAYPYALAWDGQNVWLIGDATLYRLGLPEDGTELTVVDSYAEAPLQSRVADGLAWDGQSLWLSADEHIMRLDRLGQPVCSLALPPSWQEYHQWAGLAWDGRFLWAGDYQSGRLYRVDPTACRSAQEAAAMPATEEPAIAMPTAPPTAAPSGDTPRPTAMQREGFLLPQNEPYDLAYDGAALWALFRDRLVRLEEVPGEGRLRAAETIDFHGNSLAWDAGRQQYWVVEGAPSLVGDTIDLVGRDGQIAESYAVPEAFVGWARFVAWDGAYLWLTSLDGPLHKLLPVGEGGELTLVDSYALSFDRYGLQRATGLAWDGAALWILVGDLLARLDGAAQPVCTIELPSAYPQLDWAGWRGVAWDGQFLWVGHAGAGKVYRLDPAGCEPGG